MLLVQYIKNIYSNSKCYKRSVPETCPLINIANSMIVIAFMLVLLLGYLICIGNIISYLLIVVYCLLGCFCFLFYVMIDRGKQKKEQVQDLWPIPSRDIPMRRPRDM